MIGVVRALVHARRPILTIGLVNVVGLGAGMGMAHTGNRYALDFRDRLVAHAHEHDPASIALRSGKRVRAAMLDFSRNLFLGRGDRARRRWLGVPRDAVWDAARAYVLIVPLFFVASLWEFLAR